MSLLWAVRDWPPRDNRMVAEVRPDMPSVDESVARRMRLEDAMGSLMRNMDRARDNLGAVSVILPHDLDVYRLLKDMHLINGRVTELVIRLGGSL